MKRMLKKAVFLSLLGAIPCYVAGATARLEYTGATPITGLVVTETPIKGGDPNYSTITVNTDPGVAAEITFKNMDINFINNTISGNRTAGIQVGDFATPHSLVSSGHITVQDSTITTTANAGKYYASGVVAYYGAVIDFRGTNTVNNNTVAADGMRADGGTLNIYDTTNIKMGLGTDTTANNGLELNYGSSKANVYGTLNITSEEGHNSYLLSLGTENVYDTGANQFTIHPGATVNLSTVSSQNPQVVVYDNTNMDIQGALNITAGGATAAGIEANYITRGANTGTVTGTGVINIDMTTAGATGLRALQTGEINFNGDTTVKTIDGLAVTTGDSGIIKLNANKDKTTKLTGDVANSGEAASLIDIKLSNGDSYLTGASYLRGTGKTNLDIDNNAAWNVTANSMVSSLMLSNAGTLNMHHTGADKYETVTTDSFAGNNGTIVFTTDLQKSKDTYDVNQNSDKLVITGASSGTTYVSVKDASAATGTSVDGYLLLVEDQTSGGANFVAKGLDGGGLFKYTPIITSVNPEDNTSIADASSYTGYNKTNAKNWYLVGFGVDSNNPYEPGAIPAVAGHAERYMSYWRELDNLLLRLGELRDYENTDGVWARVKTAEDSLDKAGINKDRWAMYQLGYDHRYKNDTEKGRKYWGLAVDYIKGSQDYREGATGESSATSLSLYDTWFGTKGHYLDLIGKAGRMNRSYDYYGVSSDSGDSRNWYYSLSAEYGRKIMKEENGWYYEPQTQLTYGHVNSANFTSKQGVSVNNDAFNSLVWRVGTTVGKHYGGTEDGKRSNIYAKAFWNHEFMGDLDYSLGYNTDRKAGSDNYGGSWWTVGIGANAQLNTKTNVYADISKNFGGDIDRKWQVNVGLRWSWDKKAKSAAPEVDTTNKVTYTMVPAQKRESYFDSVYFGFDEDIPLPGERAKIAHFAEVAKENPEVTYALVGNTDSIGTDAYNEDLSRRRVEKVKAMAEQDGVSSSRLQDSYEGAAKPVQSNETASGRAANRRVEIYEHK